jgi:hypothetical protein
MAESSKEPRVVVINEDGDTVLVLKGRFPVIPGWSIDW